jgi:hypothetical protein
MYLIFHSKYPLLFSHLNETSILSTEFRKILSCQILLKPVPWESTCSVLTDGQTDMTKLIIIFRNFAKAPKNAYNFTCAINNRRDNNGIQRSFRNCGSSAYNLPSVTLLAPIIWRWLLHSLENLWNLWNNFLIRPINT